MKTPRPSRNNRQRLLIAQHAAQILIQSGYRDYLSAKTKAAERLGVLDTKQLPSNAEVEQAIAEYQGIFDSDNQSKSLRELRQSALQAMKLLSEFSPRLVGAVLAGTADKNSPVHLHVFADTCEEIQVFLLSQNIPFDTGDQKVRYAKDTLDNVPAFYFQAGQFAVQLSVFSQQRRREAPLSPVTSKTMERASVAELEKLILLT